jgi:hypothetical protein
MISKPADYLQWSQANFAWLGVPVNDQVWSRCDRSLVGTESKRMLVFAEEVICLREFRKIWIGVAADREQPAVMLLRSTP